MKPHSKVIPTGVNLALACAAGVWAQALAVAAAAATEPARQLPTAAEIIQLRSNCAAIGQQILEGNFIRSALYQQQFSHYSPRTNRCYVEMRVQTADPDQHLDRVGQYLYDGQTREMLAFTQIQNGKKSGRVFDLHHRTTSFENAEWDDANQYISATMTDNRR